MGAPAIGSDGSIYVSTQAAKFKALDESGIILWSIDLSGASESSPALDCSRDDLGAAKPGRPGVAYVGSDGGFLYAFITDSRGIDTRSPWPKFHRDPRNTADASLDLAAEFTCP